MPEIRGIVVGLYDIIPPGDINTITEQFRRVWYTTNTGCNTFARNGILEYLNGIPMTIVIHIYCIMTYMASKEIDIGDNRLPKVYIVI